MEREELTYTIIGCARRMHRVPGIGLQEMICRRYLAIELADTGLDFVREKEQTLWYKGSLVGTLRADFGMEERLIVERKAVINLEEVHLAQAKNQVIACDFARGMLINFGAINLQYKLIFNLRNNTPLLPNPH